MTIYRQVFFLLLLFSGHIKAQQTKPVVCDSALQEFISSGCFKTASIGFYAYNTDDSTLICSYNENLSLIPASALKIVTTATALEVLHPFYRFKTRLQYTGTIDTTTKTLNGNLLVKGGGDPCLGSLRFKSKYYKPFFLDVWLDSLKQADIHNVQGNLIIDDRLFDNNIPTTWVWGDIGNYYGAGAYGLSVFDNTYSLVLASPDTVNGPVQIKDIVPGGTDTIQITNRLLSSKRNKDLAYLFGDPLTYKRLLQGTIPFGRDSFIVKGSLPNPPDFFGKYFYKYLVDSGININGKVLIIDNKNFDFETDTLPKTNLALTYSPYLTSIISLTNTYSINLYAQHLFKAISLKRVRQATNITAASYIKDFWKNKEIDTEGMELYDGCGLSRYNTVTAKQLVDILVYMKNKSKYYKYFYKSLPIGGRTGTLHRVFKNKYLKNNIRAKSGTMIKVKTYAGYFTTVSGKTIAFAILINNYNGTVRCVNNKIQTLLTKIYLDE